MIRVAARTNPDRNVLLPEYFQQEIFVFSSGYQHFKTKDYHINRPNGRRDFQLLYIYKGFGHFLIDRQWKTYGPGSIILYHPDEPQIYYYEAKDDPEIYWVHFLGLRSEEILQSLHIRTGEVGQLRKIRNVFDEIILELQLRKD